MDRHGVLLCTLVIGILRITEAEDNLQCPPPSDDLSPCVWQPYNCLSDRDCQNGNKCCPSGCGQICVKGVCGPVCEIACGNGFELKRDAYGCQLCQCVNACQNEKCPVNHYCELEQHSGCSSSSCPLYPMCTACEPLDCQACPKGWTFVIDDRGCQTCRCQDVCAGIICPNGEVCRPHYKQDCPLARCNPVPRCSPIDPTVNRQCPRVETLKLEPCVEACQSDSVCGIGEKCCYNGCGRTCVEAVCGPQCDIACQSGYQLKIDPFGCELCECVHPCENRVCPPDTYCQLQSVQCVAAPCDAVAVCLACPALNCACPSDSVHVTAPSGCKTCDCRHACVNHVCEYGQECNVQTGPSGPYPVCTGTGVTDNYRCPPPNPATYGVCIYKCQKDSDCQFGDKCCDNGCGDTCMKGVCGPQCAIACGEGYELQKDRYGCIICNCVRACDNQQCPSGSYCEVNEVPCGSASCTQTECKTCPQYACPACPYGWARQRDAHGCLSCACKDVCQDFYCAPYSRCEALMPPCPAGSTYCDPVPICVPTSIPPNPATPCPDFQCPACPAGLVPRRDAVGCLTCVCYNPCSGVVCPVYRHCEVRLIPCMTPPCAYTNLCVPDGSTFGSASSLRAWWLTAGVLVLSLLSPVFREH